MSSINLFDCLNKPKRFRKLLDDGANTNIRNEKGDTLLIHSLYYSYGAVNILLDRNICIEERNKSGKTPLNIACFLGLYDIVKVLLDKDVDIESQDDYGNTPLIEACENGYLDIVSILLDKGANINSRNKNGMTPFIVALTPLIVACSNTDDDDKDSENVINIVKLLLEKGANVNDRDNYGGNTALCYASIYNKEYDLVEVLLEHGGNIFIENKKGLSPYSYAINHNITYLIDLFKSYNGGSVVKSAK